MSKLMMNCGRGVPVDLFQPTQLYPPDDSWSPTHLPSIKNPYSNCPEFKIKPSSHPDGILARHTIKIARDSSPVGAHWSLSG